MQKFEVWRCGARSDRQPLVSWINTNLSSKIGTHLSSASLGHVKRKGLVGSEDLRLVKREITKGWREVNADKAPLRRLMNSILQLCRAVVQRIFDQLQ